MKLTENQLPGFMAGLRELFDVARLVDASAAEAWDVSEDGRLVACEGRCHAIWGKSRRCRDCTSARALSSKGQASKFEIADNEAFFVVSTYVEVDGSPYVLETVRKVGEDALFGANGKSRFLEMVETYSKRLWLDQLTGACNRRYFDEQIKSLEGFDAAAFVDVDDFKSINDSFGHAAGDYALKEIASALASSVRPSDPLVRLGGDEFVIAFRGMPPAALAGRLEEARRKVAALRFPETPDLRVSVSIGGACGAGGIEQLVARADEALYRAKEGKDRVVLAPVDPQP